MRACESRPGGARGAARGHLRTATGLGPHPPENFICSRGSYAAVVKRDDKLWFENRPLPPQSLTYVGNDEFVREGPPYGYRLYFGPDAPERRSASSVSSEGG
jgi:hypothetical protein